MNYPQKSRVEMMNVCGGRMRCSKLISQELNENCNNLKKIVGQKSLPLPSFSFVVYIIGIGNWHCGTVKITAEMTQRLTTLS